MSEGLTKQEVSATDGKDEIHVRWVMPEAFEDLPLGQDEEEIVRRLEDLAQKFLPGADDDLLVRWCLLCVLGCSDLEAAGTQYAGLCAVDIDGEPCVTTVFATLSPADAITAGVGGPVKSLVAGLRAMDLGEVSGIELPVEPRSAASGPGWRTRGHLADLGPQTGEIRTSFIQVHIPSPTERSCP
ncbi:hypothetical protein NKH77_23370 [Streptomyces sp. M19]